MSVTADDVRRAVGAACTALEAASKRDWSVVAGDLDWDCRQTAEHIANALVSYAGQLISQPVSGWLPFVLTVEQASTTTEVVSVIRMSGELLAATVAASPSSACGWHPYGMADREAFAAMAIVETFVHTHDMAQGLQFTWSPPEHLCEKALRRLFPDRPAAQASWQCLLWCTGRADLPHLPRRGSWSWQNDW